MDNEPHTHQTCGSRTPGAADGGADYDFREQAGHLLRRTYQRHVAIFQQAASDPALTSVQFVTLCALRDHGPSSQSTLVRATAVDQGTIRGILDRLKGRGLIALSADPQDRRKVIASLTEAGARTLDEMVPCARQITELTLQNLNPAERIALMFLLRKMLGPDGE
ncbi:MarR family winged helix-turn-helix transcriptional regulator [Xanthobacteraceae bacterium A53D]